MAYVKNTLFMSCGQFEWTEQYYDMNNSATGTAAAIERTRALGVARANILGQQAQIYAIRQSLDTAPRATTTVFAEDGFSNTPWEPSNNTSTMGPSGRAQNPDLSIVTEFQLSSYPWRALKHVGGVPSSAMVGPRNVLEGSVISAEFNLSRWMGKFNDFISDGTWGIGCKQVGASKIPITAISLVAGTNYLSITTGSAVGAAARDSVYIRNAKYNVKVPKLNGTHKVLSISSSGGNYTYILSPQLSIPAGATWAGGGTVELVSKTVIAIAKVRPLSTSGKKRGERSLGSPSPAR